jgi:ornithine cyclodeaminase/alanine dehydrogenase-like protein (mu-crystallin family)
MPLFPEPFESPVVMIRILNAESVRTLLPMAECIPLMRAAFLTEAEGRAGQPIRANLPHPGGKGLLAWMPGSLTSPDWLGMKLLTIHPGNFGTEIGTHQGFVMLFDAANGRPVALMDAREITAIRTAAATAAATDLLAPPSASSLGIFGYGEQAATHLEAIKLVRRILEVRVWGRDLERSRAFIAHHAPEIGIAVEDPEQAAKMDILCLTTAAKEPYFEGNWLRPGQHLNAVGSSVPTTAEIDNITVARARFFVDFAESARALAGEYRRALEAGVIEPSHMLGSVGDVLAGRLIGRRGDSDITIFKSLGMVAEDLLVADYLLRKAQEMNVGTTVDF